MTLSGWIFMLVSWGVIIGLFTFCMMRTLKPGLNKDNVQPSSQQGENDQELRKNL